MRSGLLFISLVCFSPLSPAATTELGQELNLAVQDGKPSINVVYNYDKSFRWAVSYRTELAKPALEALPDEMQWNLYDQKYQTYFNGWKKINREQLVVGLLVTDNENEVRNLLPRQGNLVLVFATLGPQGRGAEPRYYLPIGKFCQELAPTTFSDLTHPGKRCDAILPSDLARNPPISSIDQLE